MDGVTGDALRFVSEDVHRIGDHHENALKRGGRNLRDDGFQNFYVLLNQIQTGFTGFLIGPGRDDGQSAVGQVFVGTGVNVHGRSVGQPVAQIHGLAFRFFLVCVNQDHFRKQAFLHQTKGNGSAYKAAAYHSDFSGV